MAALARLIPHDPKFDTLSLLSGSTSFVVGRGKSLPRVMAVSSRHFRFEARDGEFFVTDLSKNGTFLNEERLARGVETPIRIGDQLGVVVKSTRMPKATDFPVFTLVVPTSASPPTLEPETPDLSEANDVTMFDSLPSSSRKRKRSESDSTDTNLPPPKRRRLDGAIPANTGETDDLPPLDSQTRNLFKAAGMSSLEIDEVIADTDAMILQDRPPPPPPPAPSSPPLAPADEEIEEHENETKPKKTAQKPKQHPPDLFRLELTCEICADLYYKPVLFLPCRHSFCGPCASLWCLDNSKTNCPKCRSEVDKVRSDFKLGRLVDTYLDTHPSRKRSEESRERLDEKNQFTEEYLRRQDEEDRNRSGQVAQATRRAQFMQATVGAFGGMGRSYGGGGYGYSFGGGWTGGAGGGGGAGVRVRFLASAPAVTSCTECNAVGMDGYQCPTNAPHQYCSKCTRALPYRTDTSSPPLPPERCLTCKNCSRAYCQPYFSDTQCPSGESLKLAEEFEWSTMPDHSFSILNSSDYGILSRWMSSKGISPQDLWNRIVTSIKNGESKYFGRPNHRTPLHTRRRNHLRLREWNLATDRVCHDCAKRLFGVSLFTFLKDDVPETELDVTDRPPAKRACWYGWECRTQWTRPHHRDRLTHFGENTRNGGSGSDGGGGGPVMSPPTPSTARVSVTTTTVPPPPPPPPPAPITTTSIVSSSSSPARRRLDTIVVVPSDNDNSVGFSLEDDGDGDW